jgi:hypothetical protein
MALRENLPATSRRRGLRVRNFLSAIKVENDESSVDITPMLDVVFIMLIFFIVTATFIKEAGIDVDKPEAATAVVQEKASILVAIDAERPGVDQPAPGRCALRALHHRAPARGEPQGHGGHPGRPRVAQ